MTGSTDWAQARTPDSLPSFNVPAGDRDLRLFGLDDGDHIFATVRATGTFYEEPLLRFVGAFLDADDLVVDVGANIGNHTAYFAGVLSCQVRAFEAVPVLADVLSLTVRANFLDSRVRVEPYAVGRRAGFLSVASWNPSNSGATRLADAEGGVIPVVALDELDWPEPPRAVKIDVEGMELEVLEGAAELIARHHPLLLVEAADPEAETAVRDWVGRHGYAVLGVFNATPTLVCTPTAGAPGRTPDEAIYRTLEHLAARIDDLHAHMDRLARYVRQVQVAVEKTLEDVRPPVGSGPARSPDVIESAVVRSLQEQNTDLRAKLHALEQSVRNPLPDSTTKVPAHE